MDPRRSSICAQHDLRLGRSGSTAHRSGRVAGRPASWSKSRSYPSSRSSAPSVGSTAPPVRAAARIPSFSACSSSGVTSVRVPSARLSRRELGVRPKAAGGRVDRPQLSFNRSPGGRHLLSRCAQHHRCPERAPPRGRGGAIRRLVEQARHDPPPVTTGAGGGVGPGVVCAVAGGADGAGVVCAAAGGADGCESRFRDGCRVRDLADRTVDRWSSMDVAPRVSW